MNISLTQPVVSDSDIFICDTSADIEVSTNLIAAGKIYIIGKNVIIKENAKLESTIKNDIVVLGVQNSTLAGKAVGGDGYLLSGSPGRKFYLECGKFPIEWLSGRHISVNLQKVITITD